MFKGYDISAIQGKIDYTKLASNGISFVILRGYVGNDFFDATFARNLAAAKAAGLKVGVYNFCYILPSDSSHANRDPKQQAALHFKSCGSNILAACDIEWPLPVNWKTWKVDAAFVRQWTLSYAQEYERLSGQKPLIYTYPDFDKQANFGSMPELANYPLWIASYKAQPEIVAPWTTWAVWQSGQEKMVGHTVNVDVDYCNDLSIFDICPVAAPITAPTAVPPTSPLTTIVPVDNAPVQPVVPVLPPSKWASIKNFLSKTVTAESVSSAYKFVSGLVNKK